MGARTHADSGTAGLRVHPAWSRRARLPLLLLATVGGLSLPSPGQGQVVLGHLLETGSRDPIVSGSVMLLDTAFAVAAATTTNNTGAFRLEAPGPGDYYVLCEALGFRPSIDGILSLGEGGSITIEYYLQPKPLVLDSLIVAVERAQVYQHLQKAGFYDRQTTGFGHFITPEEIKQRQPAYFSDLFRNTPGVRVRGSALNGTTIEIVNASIRGATCTPRVFVDGILVTLDYGGLESVVDINQVSGVEVYTRASSVPPQWGGTGSGCGVVLIWTR